MKLFKISLDIKLIERIFVIFLILVIIVSGFILSKPQIELYKVGIFNGLGNGHHGQILVEVETDIYSILNIRIKEEQEMPIIGKIVYKEIPKEIISKNDSNVDIVAGATFTSEGLIEAVEDALKKARLETRSD